MLCKMHLLKNSKNIENLTCFQKNKAIIIFHLKKNSPFNFAYFQVRDHVFYSNHTHFSLLKLGNFESIVFNISNSSTARKFEELPCITISHTLHKRKKKLIKLISFFSGLSVYFPKLSDLMKKLKIYWFFNINIIILVCSI